MKNAFYNGNNALYGWHTWRIRRVNEFWWVEGTKLTFVSDQANKLVLVFIRVRGSKAFKLHENDDEDEYKVPDPSRTERVLVFVFDSKALKINNGSTFTCFSLLVIFMKVGSHGGVILQSVSIAVSPWVLLMSFEKLFLHVFEHNMIFLRMRFLRRVQKWFLESN